MFGSLGSGRTLAQEFTPLTIVSQDGSANPFLVEFANTPQTRARGLMFRRHLPENRGMLFDFGKMSDVQMWMKNTYIPLDMIFIRADGVIHRIERETEPHSLRVIASGGPVKGVLELAGGTTARLVIRVGDRVEHDMFLSD